MKDGEDAETKGGENEDEEDYEERKVLEGSGTIVVCDLEVLGSV